MLLPQKYLFALFIKFIIILFLQTNLISIAMPFTKDNHISNNICFVNHNMLPFFLILPILIGHKVLIIPILIEKKELL
jgi:hypothetical protein